jgi:hypothetical protein
MVFNLLLVALELNTAESLLKSYITNVPERTDYSSHHEAFQWLRATEGSS